MQLQVRGKQIDVGDALRGHVEERLDGAVGKYFTQAVDANVVFSREAHLFRADIQVHAGKNIFVQSNGEAEDPYVAFDLATDKIAKRLRRYKRRLTDHHKRTSNEPPLEAHAFVLQGEPADAGEDHTAPEEPVVVAELTEPVETLTVSDAVMRLDLGDLPALMFRNAAHGGLNMIYRRPDGNVGWVDPRGARQSQ